MNRRRYVVDDRVETIFPKTEKDRRFGQSEFCIIVKLKKIFAKFFFILHCASNIGRGESNFDMYAFMPKEKMFVTRTC